MKNPFNMNRDAILASLGLQSRRSAATYVLPAIGMFGVGILTGAGLGLLFAPRTGREMRRELGTRMNDLGHKVTDATKQVTNKIKSKVRKTTDEVAASLEDARGSLYDESDFSTGLGGNGMDSGRRTGLTNSST
jgi:hypothetical protein